MYDLSNHWSNYLKIIIKNYNKQIIQFQDNIYKIKQKLIFNIFNPNKDIIRIGIFKTN